MKLPSPSVFVRGQQHARLLIHVTGKGSHGAAVTSTTAEKFTPAIGVDEQCFARLVVRVSLTATVNSGLDATVYATAGNAG